MEPDKRYFEGKGLYRLVRDGLESEEDAVRVQDAINAGKHGKSTVWHRTWRYDDDGIPTPGSFAVYQQIMHDRDVSSSEDEQTRPERSRREQCELDSQSRRIDDLNTKLNLTIISLIGAVMSGVAGYLYYIVQLTELECFSAMLIIGICVMTGLWLHCECRDHCRC